MCGDLAHHTGKERADDKSFMSAVWVSLRRMVRLRHQDVRQETQRVLFYEARNARDPDEHLAHFDFDLGVWTASDLTAKKHRQKIALKIKGHSGLVFKGMKEEEYYRRNELESLARQQLRRYNKPNGNKACQAVIMFRNI